MVQLTQLLPPVLFLLGLTCQEVPAQGHYYIQSQLPGGAIRYVREVSEITETEPTPSSSSVASPQQVETVGPPPSLPSTSATFEGAIAIKEHKDAEILEIIRQGLERIRHAEKRLKKFVNKIEDGIKSGLLNETIEKVKTKIETGKIDLHKFVADLKERKTLTLQDLIKRISDDSFLLLDKLNGRKGLKSDPTSDEDKSTEDKATIGQGQRGPPTASPLIQIPSEAHKEEQPLQHQQYPVKVPAPLLKRQPFVDQVKKMEQMRQQNGSTPNDDN